MADENLRPARSAEDLRAAGERLSLAVVALAPALMEPWARLLLDDAGGAVLLRRQWAGDGTAEAVVLHRTGITLDHPSVVATAAGWGCETIRHASTDRRIAVLAPFPEAPLATRFRHLAAIAATRVEVAVALARDSAGHAKDDGSPSLAADQAAHAAAVEVLAPLGLPVLSEESRDVHVPDGQPWIVLDPLDGTGNFSAGLPPWAFSAGLVADGRPLAGLVADLSSGRRWSGATGVGAWRDGVPISPRRGTTVIVPSAPTDGVVAVPSTARRVRITGCTAIDLCLVADGSAAAFHDLDRSGSHVYDAAGGLGVLLAAGGVALTEHGEPLELRPDSDAKIRLVAASSEPAACELLDAVG